MNPLHAVTQGPRLMDALPLRTCDFPGVPGYSFQTGRCGKEKKWNILEEVLVC